MKVETVTPYLSMTERIPDCKHDGLDGHNQHARDDWHQHIPQRVVPVVQRKVLFDHGANLPLPASNFDIAPTFLSQQMFIEGVDDNEESVVGLELVHCPLERLPL